MFDVITTRNSLDSNQQHGFDLAASTRIGTVANPKPQTLSPAGHAGYAISLGMRSHSPNEKVAEWIPAAHNLDQISEVGVDNWFVRLLRALGLHK